MLEQGLDLLLGFGTKCKVSLAADKMETAQANVVQRMSFIASTLGQGSMTPERALSRGSRAQGRAARVFIGYCWGWGKSVLESRGRFLLGAAGG